MNNPIRALKDGQEVGVYHSNEELIKAGFYPQLVRAVLAKRRRVHLGCTFERLIPTPYESKRLSSFSFDERLELIEDFDRMTPKQMAGKWNVTWRCLRNWRRELDCKLKPDPNRADHKYMSTYRGFNVSVQQGGHYSIEGSGLCTSSMKIAKRVIDTYLRRTGKEAGEYAA